MLDVKLNWFYFHLETSRLEMFDICKTFNIFNQTQVIKNANPNLN